LLNKTKKFRVDFYYIYHPEKTQKLFDHVSAFSYGRHKEEGWEIKKWQALFIMLAIFVL